MKHLAVLLFCLCSSAHIQNNDIPIVYNNGPKTLRLFISFSCVFCFETLQIILKNKKAPFNLRIYYFDSGLKLDRKKTIFILSAQNDLPLIQELIAYFLHETNEAKIIAFVKNKPKIMQNLKKNYKQYAQEFKIMQKKFIDFNIEGSPTLIIDKKKNEVIKIEGVPENLEKFLAA